MTHYTEAAAVGMFAVVAPIVLVALVILIGLWRRKDVRMDSSPPFPAPRPSGYRPKRRRR